MQTRNAQGKTQTLSERRRLGGINFRQFRTVERCDALTGLKYGGSWNSPLRNLSVPFQQKFRQSFESDSFAFESRNAGQRGESFGRQLFCNLPRFFQAHNRRIGRLLRPRVLARRFAELLAGLRHVQNVVNDLEREADVITEIRQCLELRRSEEHTSELQ